MTMFRTLSRRFVAALLLTVGANFMTATSAQAQVQIGSSELSQMNSAGKLSTEDFETFKKTTTVFVVQSKDADRLADFEKSIGQVWKITPFRVILPGDMNRFASEEYSFFTFGGYSFSFTDIYISYDLWVPRFKEDGAFKNRLLYARMLLFADEQTRDKSLSLYRTGSGFGFNDKKNRQESSVDVVDMFFTTGHYQNWGPGMIKGYLKVINDRLLQQQRQGPFSSIMDAPELLPNLAKDTLFVPRYVHDTYNLRTKKYTIGKDALEADVAKDYPYPIKYVTPEELDHMLVHRTTPFYYLIYIRSGINKKFITVFDGRSGQAAYSDFVTHSYNFSTKDLARLAKYVKKG